MKLISLLVIMLFGVVDVFAQGFGPGGQNCDDRLDRCRLTARGELTDCSEQCAADCAGEANPDRCHSDCFGDDQAHDGCVGEFLDGIEICFTNYADCTVQCDTDMESVGSIIWRKRFEDRQFVLEIQAENIFNYLSSQPEQIGPVHLTCDQQEILCNLIPGRIFLEAETQCRIQYPDTADPDYVDCDILCREQNPNVASQEYLDCRDDCAVAFPDFNSEGYHLCFGVASDAHQVAIIACHDAWAECEDDPCNMVQE